MNQLFYLVAGLGQTGHSIAGYLQRRKIHFAMFDTREYVESFSNFRVDFPDVDLFLGKVPEALFDRLTAVVASPGVALNHPVLKEAKRRNIPIIGDIECFAQEVKAPVVAITGTNGKSTVTTLVGKMAEVAGLKVAVAGNIGLPVLDLLDNEIDYDLWVLELSSFQLELTSSLKPVAATILNISPDHLDRHADLAAYIKAKQRIYNQAKVCLFNRNDKQTIPTNIASTKQFTTTVTTVECPTSNVVAKTISYGLDAPPTLMDWGLNGTIQGSYLSHGEKQLLGIDKLRLKGRHNWENALAACALAKEAGIPEEAIITVLESFEGLAHRCQWIRTLEGVDWINDSKGTNVGATQSALVGLGNALQGKIILIAGGIGKGADFSDLELPIKTYARSVILIGQDADKIEKAVVNSAPIRRASSLEEAINMARLEAIAGDVVLLSPACASFDMFRDFNHRGEVFAALVRAL